MDALLTSTQQLKKWFYSMANLLTKRAKKNIRKRKGKEPKPSAWQIIKLLT